jgi:hypothetical protein
MAWPSLKPRVAGDLVMCHRRLLPCPMAQLGPWPPLMLALAKAQRSRRQGMMCPQQPELMVTMRLDKAMMTGQGGLLLVLQKKIGQQLRTARSTCMISGGKRGGLGLGARKGPMGQGRPSLRRRALIHLMVQLLVSGVVPAAHQG